MAKLKNVLLMGLSFVLVAALAIGGTVAYLSDTDSDVNVMTLGNVSIAQHELERADMTEQSQTEAAALQNFTQGQALYPAVLNMDGKSAKDTQAWAPGGASGALEDHYVNYGDFVTADVVEGATAWNGVWGTSLNNVMDKFVFVENTGKSDAYYRTIILLEYDETESKNSAGQTMIHYNYNGNTLFSWEHNLGTVTVDGEKYFVLVATYQNALKSGTVSRPSLLQVGLDGEATNEIVAQFGATYDILVLSQAVQAEGFTSADQALDAGFGDATLENIAEWFGGTSISAPADDAALKNDLQSDDKTIVVNLTSDMTYDVDAWANEAMGGSATEKVVINGNGHTITFNNTNSDWNNIVTNGATLVINNATVTNSGYDATSGTWNAHDLNFGCDVEFNYVTFLNAVAVRADATFNNCKITDDSTGDAYLLWIQPNGQTVTLNGCEIDATGTDGDDRGIKIDAQYVDAPAKVTLNVKDTSFKTEKKAAIVVKSSAGADITLDNVDISGVTADTTNAVWVDSDASEYAELVKVTGGSVITEQ